MSRIRQRPADRTAVFADRRGVAALELALAAPMLLVLMLGSYDLTLWIRAGFRLDSTASNMGEVISQCTAINDPADIQQFSVNAQLLAGTTDISSNSGGAFIMSAVGTNTSGNIVVLWQRRSGNPAFGSHVGAAGNAASLGAYSPPAGEVLITTEVFSAVQPWTLGRALMVAPSLPALYSSAMFLVRSSSSSQLATLSTAAAGVLACAS